MPKMLGQKAVTPHIKRRVTQSIFRAFDFAAAKGTPLNLYVVINLHESDAACATTIFDRVRHKYRDWLNYRTRNDPAGPLPPLYVYTVENPSGDHHHVNWALHIPAKHRAAFEQRLPRWIEKTQGVCGPRDNHVASINSDRAKRLAKYIVKGTDPAFIRHFYLEGVHVPQGDVWGKRAGVSPSLGATARRDASFRPRRQTNWKLAA